MKFIFAIMFEILVEGLHELESFLGSGREDSGDLPEAGAGFVGAERAFEGDDGDNVMSESVAMVGYSTVVCAVQLRADRTLQYRRYIWYM